jgi:hypothetical protein
MSFNIERESDGKNIKTDISGLAGDQINIQRDSFTERPKEHNPEEELGMEFMLPETSSKSEENEERNSEEMTVSDEFLNENHNNGDSFQDNTRTYAQIQDEKSGYLSQLKRLEKKGNVLSRKFTMEHSLDEIRNEVIRIKKEQQVDASIDYCRQGLMFCVSTIEMADSKYNFGAELGGWSRNVMGSIENYDSVFEELYEKYAGSIGVMPEMKLISMLAGSAFMYSLQKKLVNGKQPAPRQREMDGPSIDTDELMQQLAEVDIDDDDLSEISDDSIVIHEEPEEKKVIDIKKKRGRPKKNP